MTTAEIIKQMEKSFDERFPGDVATMEEDGIHARITSSLYNRDRLKSFMREYTRTLLESFGEEIIGESENISGSTDYRISWGLLGRNKLKAEQRLKVKEIISSIGK